MPVTQQSKWPACPTTLTAGEIDHYQRNGYLVFTNVLTAREVADAKAALTELVSRVAHHPQAERDGRSWKMPGAPLFVLFQDMALVKPPFVGSEKPWHQDTAYFRVAPLDAVAGVWIALDDATVANGCMHVIPGGHRQGPKLHFHGRDCEIVDGRLDLRQQVPVELPAGGAMFFHGLLPHQTPPNSSPDRRRALQFHYRSATSRELSREEYDRVFAEADGTPASCAAASRRREARS